MFDILHLDLFPVIFDYLTQRELLNILQLFNRQFHHQLISNYIPKRLEIINDKTVYRAPMYDMIISMKLYDRRFVSWYNKSIWGTAYVETYITSKNDIGIEHTRKFFNKNPDIIIIFGRSQYNPNEF